MVEIIFETHSTTTDNENDIASGWADSALSGLGISQAKQLRERYKNIHLDAVFCSDLKRSYETAEIAFGNKFPIIKDSRLRECNYGKLTMISTEALKKQKANYINKPFPNGESYDETTEKVRAFLKDLIGRYDSKKVMIIGHRATQYGLEHLINKVLLEEAVLASWKWQPGWTYKFEIS